MKNDEKIITQKKTSQRKYILMAGIVVLLIISALVFSFLQKPKPDQASEYLIRQLAAKELNKDPNELTDEDFAGIKEFEIGSIVNSYGSGVVDDYKELSDIKLLEKFTGLQELSLLIRFPQEDIPKWVKIMAKWGIIDLRKRFAIDLTPLEKLNNLERLHINSSQIKELEPLSNLVNLRYLSLGDIQVSDLKLLKKLTNLETLQMYQTSISDLEPLRNLSNLQSLDIWDVKVSNLEPLKKLTNLENLTLRGTLISDIKPLKNLANLEEFSLSDTKVSSLEPLEGLKTIYRKV